MKNKISKEMDRVLRAQREVIRLNEELKKRDAAAIEACMKKQDDPKLIAKLPLEKSAPRFRNQFEVLLVAVGLAFGIRALFIQPFKIPTGSMQTSSYSSGTFRIFAICAPIRSSSVICPSYQQLW